MVEPYTKIEHDITFQQIQAFLTIARCHSLSKAANEMLISQPALSKTLKRFEEGIGVPLFIRSNQGVSLTDAGKGLYLVFRSLYENLERTISSVKQSARKFLHMAVPLNYDFSKDFAFIKSLVQEYQERTGIRVAESLFDLKPLCRAFEFGSIDLMLIPSFADNNIQNINRRHISEFELCLAVSADSPYESLDFPEVFDNQMVHVMSTTDTQSDTEYYNRLCRRLGFIPSRLGFPPNIQTLLHGIRHGRGIGICWMNNYPENCSDIRYLPIPHAISQLYVDVAWNPDEVSPEAQEFIDMLP